MDEHREQAQEDVHKLRKQPEDQFHRMQRLGEQMEGKYEKLYQDVELEHGWVFKHFQGVKTLVESNHASLVGKVHEFTGH